MTAQNKVEFGRLNPPQDVSRETSWGLDHHFSRAVFAILFYGRQKQPEDQKVFHVKHDTMRLQNVSRETL